MHRNASRPYYDSPQSIRRRSLVRFRVIYADSILQHEPRIESRDRFLEVSPAGCGVNATVY